MRGPGRVGDRHSSVAKPDLAGDWGRAQALTGVQVSAHCASSYQCAERTVSESARHMVASTSNVTSGTYVQLPAPATSGRGAQPGQVEQPLEWQHREAPQQRQPPVRPQGGDQLTHCECRSSDKEHARFKEGMGLQPGLGLLDGVGQA